MNATSILSDSSRKAANPLKYSTVKSLSSSEVSGQDSSPDGNSNGEDYGVVELHSFGRASIPYHYMSR